MPDPIHSFPHAQAARQSTTPIESAPPTAMICILRGANAGGEWQLVKALTTIGRLGYQVVVVRWSRGAAPANSSPASRAACSRRSTP